VYLFAWSSSQALVSSVIAAVWSDAILNYQFTSIKIKKIAITSVADS
jgi:hypothetical protein